MHGKNFAVDHYVYRRIQFELNALCLPSLGQGVIDVCPVVEGREIADKADTANGPPAHIFNQAIVNIGIGCDHHRTASKFAIAKGQEETASVVELLVAIYTERKWPTPEPCQADEDGQLVTEFTPATESACPHHRYVRRKSHAEKIDVVNDALVMPETEDITGPRTAGD